MIDGGVIMPDSSGGEFYTVWFHIDKVFFYRWYKIAWRHLVVACLDFLIVRRNMIVSRVYKKQQPGNWNSLTRACLFTIWGCLEWKTPSTELGFLNVFALRRKGEQIGWGWWEGRRLELGRESCDIRDAASTPSWYSFLKMLTYRRRSANIT